MLRRDAQTEKRLAEQAARFALIGVCILLRTHTACAARAVGCAAVVLCCRGPRRRRRWRSPVRAVAVERWAVQAVKAGAADTAK